MKEPKCPKCGSLNSLAQLIRFPKPGVKITRYYCFFCDFDYDIRYYPKLQEYFRVKKILEDLTQ